MTIGKPTKENNLSFPSFSDSEEGKLGGYSESPPSCKHVLQALTQALQELGEEGPRRQARTCLAHLLGCTEQELLLAREEWPKGCSWNSPLEKRLQDYLVQRKSGSPWGYIFQQSPFWGRSYCVDSTVLIPRADSEVLVEEALRSAGKATRAHPLNILEFCTGSGALLITLLLELQEQGQSLGTICGTDLSAQALTVAQMNHQRLASGIPIRWLEGDLEAALKLENLPCAWDLILMNPPYIAQQEMEGLAPEVRDQEPWLALTDGGDGLAFYRRIFPIASQILAKGGTLHLEFGYQQAEAVCALASDLAPTLVLDQLRKDYAGHLRVGVWQKPSV